MKNQVNLIGHVGADPQVKLVGYKQTKKAEFNLATNKSWKNEAGEQTEKVQWHSIEAWGAIATITESYVKKGMLISITGEIEYNIYDDKDGAKKNFTKIVANEIKMLSSPKDS